MNTLIGFCAGLLSACIISDILGLDEIPWGGLYASVIAIACTFICQRIMHTNWEPTNKKGKQ